MPQSTVISELDAGGGQLVDRRRRDAVAVAEAVGQPPAHVGAELAAGRSTSRNVAVMPSAS